MNLVAQDIRTFLKYGPKTKAYLEPIRHLQAALAEIERLQTRIDALRSAIDGLAE